VRAKTIAILCGLCTLLGAQASWADAALEEQRARTQAQREQLQQRVQQLQREIERTQGQRDDVREQLRDVEAAISKRGQTLDRLATELSDTENKLQSLEADYAEQSRYKKELQKRLAEQLRAQYAGGLSPWVALLSAQDPNEIQRELHYLGYVTEAQAQGVEALNQVLQQLQQIQQQTKQAQEKTAQLQSQTQTEQAELKKDFAQHQDLLAEIESELVAQRGQADQAQADEARLGALVEGLEAEIKAHRAAERAAAQEAARQAAEQARQAAEDEAQQLRRQSEEQAQQARREQAQAAEQARQREQQEALRLARQLRIGQQGVREGDLAQAPSLEELKAQRRRDEAPKIREERIEPAPSADTDADAGADAQRPAETAKAPQSSKETAAAPSASTPAPAQANGLQKGAPMPAQGVIQGRFGAERPDGGTWRGIIIQASEGSPARAIAAGEVVYADWLSGFGNLLIIDHGQGYLTVYGHNQSLLKQVGEQVRTGDEVARVGATGGQVEAGLYFEIRHQGQPVNPQLWLKAP